jgi:hypothetical protein
VVDQEGSSEIVAEVQGDRESGECAACVSGVACCCCSVGLDVIFAARVNVAFSPSGCLSAEWDGMVSLPCPPCFMGVACLQSVTTFACVRLWCLLRIAASSLREYCVTEPQVRAKLIAVLQVSSERARYGELCLWGVFGCLL